MLKFGCQPLSHGFAVTAPLAQESRNSFRSYLSVNIGAKHLCCHLSFQERQDLGFCKRFTLVAPERGDVCLGVSHLNRQRGQAR